MIDFLLVLFVCLFVCLSVCMSAYVCPLPLVRFDQLLRNADKLIVNIIKLYMERNNL